MDSTRETRDLMKLNDVVESMSLPAPPIRLFGKLFGGTTTTTTNTISTGVHQDEKEQSDHYEMKRRMKKFSCHYCWRTFPTSQALGGHQNAHRRERQLAKQTQTDHYALVNYTRLIAAWNATAPRPSAAVLPIHPHTHLIMSPPITTAGRPTEYHKSTDHLNLDLHL